MTHPVFRYRSISHPLIHEVLSDLESGISVVIIGPSNSGKGFLAQKISSALLSQNRASVVKVNFRGNSSTAEDVRRLVSDAVYAAGFSPGRGEKILSPLSGCKSPIYLFLTNPDALPRELTRSVLQDLWTRVREKSVIAVIRGEHKLGEFVYDSPSEVVLPQHYVVQNIARDLLGEYLRQYQHVVRLAFSEAVQTELIEQTGGVGDQIRSVLFALVEARARKHIAPESESISLEDIRSVIDRMPELGIGDEYFVRQLLRLLSIERKRTVFENLRSLLAGDCPALEQPSGPPGAFTLSGFATRKDGVLYLSSELMRKVALRHLTPCRIGHIHAQAGRFDDAFAASNLALPRERIWNPLILTGTIRAASAELHRQASLGRTTLWGFFSSVCQILIGLSEVSFWEFRTNWEPVFQEPSHQMRRACIAALEFNHNDPDATSGSAETQGQDRAADGGILVPPLWAGSLFGWRLAGLSQNWQFAVFVGTPSRKDYPPRPIAALIRELAEVFQQAHRRAVTDEREDQHREFLKLESEVLEKIYRQFVEHDPTVHAILSEVAAFQALRYTRVVCSLVDRSDRTIYEVSTDATDQQSLRSWPLDDRSFNLHAYVIRNKSPEVIPSIESGILTKPDPMFKDRTGAIAVCPLLGAANEVIGTIEFARSDGQIPSHEEVADFLAFGKKVALFIEQSNRLRLLQNTLDKNREALVIFNSVGERYYADRQASELFGFRSGWSTEIDRAKDPQTPARSTLMEIASSTFHYGPNARLFKHDIDKHRVLSVYGDVLKGWRDQPVASFLSILDRTVEFDGYDAFTEVAQATDLESGFSHLLTAARMLGHKWVRIYWQHNGTLRSSKFQEGLTGSDKETFESGNVILGGEDSWRCLRENRVIVFSKTTTDGEFRTPFGLDVIGVTKTNEGIVAKRPEEFWIEAPLLAASEWLGTISLQGSVDLRVERIALLQAFFSLVSRTLEALSRSKRERFEFVGKAIADYSHMLHAHVTWLSGPLFHYENLAKRYDAKLMRETNERFSSSQKDTADTLARAVAAFSNRPRKQILYEEVDLIKVCQEVFSEDLTTYEVRDDTFPIRTDQLDLKNAFREILSNSRKQRVQPLRIVIRIGELQVEARAPGAPAEAQEWFQLDIADNGPGFSKELLTDETAFDYFTRDGQGRDVPPWAGLGLSIVKALITIHGGTVEIFNSPGACIRIRLPRWNKSLGSSESGRAVTQ